MVEARGAGDGRWKTEDGGIFWRGDDFGSGHRRDGMAAEEGKGGARKKWMGEGEAGAGGFLEGDHGFGRWLGGGCITPRKVR